MSKRRKFSAEFKRGAVEQASRSGVSCAQVARELGIRDTLLTRWKREAQGQGAAAFGGSGTRSWPASSASWRGCRRSGIFCEKRRRSLPRGHPEVSGDRTLPR